MDGLFFVCFFSNGAAFCELISVHFALDPSPSSPHSPKLGLQGSTPSYVANKSHLPSADPKLNYNLHL